MLPLMKVALKKYPALIRDMETRHIYYNKELADVEQKAERGELLLIRPSADLKVSRVEKDPAKIRALYNLGRQDAAAQLDAVKLFYHL